MGIPSPPTLDELALALAAIDAQRGTATNRVLKKVDLYRSTFLREELEQRVKAWRQEQLTQCGRRDFVRENRSPLSVRYICTAAARRSELHAAESSKIVAARERRLEQQEAAEKRRAAEAKRDLQRHARAKELYAKQKQQQRRQRPATAPAHSRLSANDKLGRPRAGSTGAAPSTAPLLTADVLQVKRRPQSAAAGRGHGSAMTTAAAGAAGAPAPARPASAALASAFARKPRSSWAATDSQQPPSSRRSARPRSASPTRVVVIDAVHVVEHSVLGRAGGGGASGMLPPAG